MMVKIVQARLMKKEKLLNKISLKSKGANLIIFILNEHKLKNIINYLNQVITKYKI